MTGRIFQIQRFCTHDGPGLRTTVFMKGCGLKCQWCHNPEGISWEYQLMRNQKKCIACMRCQGTQWERCPSGALQQVGMDIEAATLAELVMRDAPFYGTDGGVTFSGGESMLQADFLAETMALLSSCGIASVVDTAGFVPFSAYEKLLPYCNHFLFDVKLADKEKHRRFTGQDNELILSNLFRLSQSGCRLWIRIPVIGQINDDEAELCAIGRILSKLPHPPEKVELLPYHDMGREKCIQLGTDYPLASDSPYVDNDRLHTLQQILEQACTGHE
ncbi:MAG: radical SAM protein [Clostridia bacterium]|nr:radical SAM protein [Clostridia bacterium]